MKDIGDRPRSKKPFDSEKCRKDMEALPNKCFLLMKITHLPPPLRKQVADSTDVIE
jgi:hypothetical protein